MIACKMDISVGVTTGIISTPTRGRTISSPATGITPLFIGDSSLPDDKKIQYQTGLKDNLMIATGIYMILSLCEKEIMQKKKKSEKQF